jgi:hypothetical protein
MKKIMEEGVNGIFLEGLRKTTEILSQESL